VNSWKVILATLVIFGSGVVTGGLLVSYAVHANGGPRPNQPAGQQQPQALTPWMQRARELLRLMDRDLDLTPEQHKRIEKLIAESAERTKKLWEPITPQMGKEMQKLHREIRDELTPEQRPKFEKITRFRAGQQNRHPGTNQPPGFPNNPAPTNAAPANP
jgi:hypothetical protein